MTRSKIINCDFQQGYVTRAVTSRSQVVRVVKPTVTELSERQLSCLQRHHQATIIPRG
ncbi:hypothetical protein [Furfurilactobacillus curtus]|uniref:Uncharacterized protein n=1 Tax=Furfurilactobacillus curtus TaxID=1746200 RepID=A0ABQ5JQL7_9LACO